MEKVSGKVLDKANHPNFVEMWRVKLQLDFGNSTPKQSLVDTCVCIIKNGSTYILCMYLYYIQRGSVRVCYYYYMYLNWKARTESRRRVGLRNVSRLRVDRDSAMLRPPSSPTTGSRLSLMDGLTKCVTLIFFFTC